MIHLDRSPDSSANCARHAIPQGRNLPVFRNLPQLQPADGADWSRAPPLRNCEQLAKQSVKAKSSRSAHTSGSVLPCGKPDLRAAAARAQRRNSSPLAPKSKVAVGNRDQLRIPFVMTNGLIVHGPNGTGSFTEARASGRASWRRDDSNVAGRNLAPQIPR